MSRKHSRTFNPIKRQQAKKAQQRKAVVIGTAIEATAITATIIATKKVLDDRRKAKASKYSIPASSGDFFHVADAVMNLEQARYEQGRQPLFSRSRITSIKVVRAAKKEVKAERELFTAKEVADGAGRIYTSAIGHHNKVAAKRVNSRLARINKFSRKAKQEAQINEPNLTAVND